MGENTKNRELNLMDGTVGDGDGSRNLFLPSVMFNGKESVRFAVLKRENGFPE